MSSIEVDPPRPAAERPWRLSAALPSARGAAAQWLLYCADPLGSKSEPPRGQLSPRQVRRLMLKADAHKVLPAILRNFPFPADDPGLEQVRLEASARKVEAAALSTMLRHHAGALLDAAKGLPVALVKGPAFAALYPSGLRPFGDIDLLAAPAALPELASILRAQGFCRVVAGYDPSLLEDSWVHGENNVLTVEVHTNLVHSARMRAAFSLTYEDIGESPNAPGTLLAVAVMHGAMHYFAWLRHVVDICQAARAVTTAEEELRFGALLDRTGTRMAAIIGLTLAYRLFGEARCLELARALGPARNYRFARLLIEGAVVTAPMESALVYNSWRRFAFREMLRYGALVSAGKPALKLRDLVPRIPALKPVRPPVFRRREEPRDVRVLAFTCSRHRPLMLRHCIMQMQRQSYPVDHVIYVNSPEERGDDYTTLHYQTLLRDVCHNSKSVTRIAYGPSGTYHQNYFNALKLARLDDYDLFLKVDDDDIYLKDYVLDVVRDFRKRRWDFSGATTRGVLNGHRWKSEEALKSLGLRGIDRILGVPDFMPPSTALSRRAIATLQTITDTGNFEDILWRGHLAQIPGMTIAVRKDRNFIYNIHGANESTRSWHEA